jgi:hypothetical protein
MNHKKKSRIWLYSTKSFAAAVETASCGKELFEILGIDNAPYQALRSRISKEALDISHWKNPRRKYQTVLKECPQCLKEFETLKGHPKEKTVCSRSCANTFFRSGSKGSNYKNGRYIKGGYRAIAFEQLKLVCAQCGWSEYPNVLQVHHKNRDKLDSSIENLEILCPTCHQVDHYLNQDGPFK